MFKNIIPTRLVKTKVSTMREQQDELPSQSETPADVKSPDTYGRTLLHRACWDGDEVKVKELLNSDCGTLNAKDHWGRTPLWCAVTQGHVETVRVMAEHSGVKLDTKDSYGKDLEFRANEKGYADITEVLQKEKQKRQLTLIDFNLDEKSEELLRDKLESSENKLFDVEKNLIREKLDLEIKCSEAVEKLIAEHEEKLSKMQVRHETEKEMLAKQIQNIEEKLNKNCYRQTSTAPEYPTEQNIQQLPQCPECPVCMENMLPPRRIYQCGNGHIICEICQPKIKEQKCPTCLQVFVGRAIAMEQHLRTLFMT